MMRQPLDYIFPDPPVGLDPTQLDPARVPAHVAVIMDGNGRWAKKRTLNRLNGHKAGIEAVRETIRCANDVGVDYLTIYSFSTENWKRPQDEVDGLMNLFAKTMLAELDGLHEEGVRVKTIGDLSALPEKTARAFEEAWDKTKNNPGMTLLIAVNYGARDEILAAMRAYMADCVAHMQAERMTSVADSAAEGAATGAISLNFAGSANSVGSANPASSDNPASATNPFAGCEPLTEEVLERYLTTAGIPDPDLLIRTSGEMRLSNFLLWQSAYTEFYCTDVLWPDFNRYEFLRALLDFQQRDRRFGAV